MQRSRPRAVFFDLDGTLADTAPDLAAAVQAMRVARGMPEADYASLRRNASMGARGLVGAGFGVGTEHPTFTELRDEFLSRYEQAMVVHTRLFEGMADVLSGLEREGIRWGVVSNKIERYVRPILQALELAERSACAVGGDTAGYAKPHPAPLLFGARAAGVPPEQCVYVGDDLRDIQAGRAAGMWTVAASYGYCDPHETAKWGADAQIARPLDLLAVLEL